MGKINDIRRLIAEDFDKKDRKLIEKIGYIENSFKDDVAREFNGNVDWDNLSADTVTFDMSFVCSACLLVPVGNRFIRTTVFRPSGIDVVNVTNKTDPASTGYFTTAPYLITKPLSGEIIEIVGVRGAPASLAGDKIEFTIVVYPRKNS